MDTMKKCLESRLPMKCFIIGYWHLIACLFNTVTHLRIVYVLTNGFYCDISKDSLRAIQWSWLEPSLLIINFGAHGLYPFPLILNYHQTRGIDYLPLPERDPPCYPWPFNVDIDDTMYFVINVIWLVFVVLFVKAVHKRDPGPMVLFVGITSFKLIIQIHGIFLRSSDDNGLLDIVYKITDLCLIILFIITITNHFKVLMKDSRKRKSTFFGQLYDNLKAASEKKQSTIFAISGEKIPFPRDNKEKC